MISHRFGKARLHVDQGQAELSPDLIARLRTGDRETLALAYDRYADTVFRIGYGLLGDRADAEDLVQDVFVGLPHAVRTFEGRGSFVGWLKRVAARTALMRLRQVRQRRAGLQREGWSLLRTEISAPPHITLDLEAALQHLPPSLRAVFMLWEAYGYTHDEIAEMLGIGRGASKTRLYRARRQLRRYLSEG